MTRRYTELIRLPTLEERFEYLKLNGRVAEETFGFDRLFNQIFYHTKPWKDARNHVIVRDCGCDLGIDGEDIFGKIYVHHMNPMKLEDIYNGNPALLDPEYLICVSMRTHNAIHYGDKNLLPSPMIERSRNDTCPWKH